MADTYTVKLVTVPSSEADARSAISALERLPGCSLEVYSCPQQAADWFDFPKIISESGRAYFTLDGIQRYIESKLPMGQRNL